MRCQARGGAAVFFGAGLAKASASDRRRGPGTAAAARRQVHASTPTARQAGLDLRQADLNAPPARAIFKG